MWTSLILDRDGVGHTGTVRRSLLAECFLDSGRRTNRDHRWTSRLAGNATQKDEDASALSAAGPLIGFRAIVGWLFFVDLLLRSLIRPENVQQVLNVFELVSIVRMKEAVIAHLSKALGQNMLQEPPDELHGTNGSHFVRRGATRFSQEGHPAVIKLLDPSIGDRYAINVRRKILDRRLTRSDRFAMDDPLFPPDFSGRPSLEAGLA